MFPKVTAGAGHAMDIYLTHTPLHLLLSYNLWKSQNSGTDAHFLVYGDFASQDQVVERLSDLWAGSPRVSSLPGRYRWDPHRSTQRWRRVFSKWIAHTSALGALRNARSLLMAEGVDKVYVFNDTRTEVQLLMASLAKDGEVSLSYVDEGFAAYRTEPIPSRRGWLKLVYGRDWLPLRSYGTHPLITEAILFHPMFAHRGLESKSISPMPELKLGEFELQSLYKAFTGLEQDYQDGLGPGESVVLICLPHSSMLGQRWGELRRQVEELADRESERGRLVLIKGHPRDHDQAGDWLGKRESFHFLPRALPGEVAIAMLGGRLQAVYAAASSVLITARWAFPRVQVYLFNSAVDRIPKEIWPVLIASGVQITSVRL